QKIAVIVHRDLQANAGASRNQLFIQLGIAVYVSINAEGIRVTEPVDQGAAFGTSGGLCHHRATARVVDHGLDLPDVGVDGAAQHGHQPDRQHQCEDHCHPVTPHVSHFLVEGGSHPFERILHYAASICA